MKTKLISILSLAVLAIASASCSKDTPVTPDPKPVGPGEGEVAKVFNATSEETKTSIGPDLSTIWAATDKIAVFDGTKKNIFSVQTCEESSATFTGYVTTGATKFYAAYPESAASAQNGDVITMTIPAVQTVPAGKNVGDGALLSVAYTEGSSFSFKNVCGLFQFEITDDNITAVNISGLGGEYLAGTANVTYSNTPAVTITEGAQTVTVRPESGAFAKGVYYAAVAPATLAKGLAVVMQRSSDALGGVKQSYNSVTIARNTGADLGQIKSADCVWGTYITTLEQLQNWGKSGDFNIPAILGADIAVGNWTNYYRQASHNGMFYGLGHRLYNVTMEPASGPCSFFYQPTVGVQDLVIGSKDGQTYDGVSKFTLGSSTNGYCGLMTYTAKNGAYKNITNFATYEVSTAHTTDSWVRVGAIVGAPNGGTFTDCVNYGKIVSNAQTTANVNYIGGLFGFIDSSNPAAFKGCINYGKVESNCALANSIAGIAAGMAGSSVINGFTECKNFGTIEVNASSAEVYVGGINACAWVAINYTDCVNEGDIVIKNTPTGNVYIGGIHSGTTFNTGTKVTTNFTNCVNRGNISVMKDASGTYRFIGGICGIQQVGTLDGCKNYGNLTYTATGVSGSELDMAGICGYAKGYTSSVITIKNCTNYGTISVPESVKAGPQIAGIVARTLGATGITDNKAVVIQSCSNEGAVLAKSTYVALAAGICGYSKNAYITACTNKATVTVDNAAAASSYSAVAGGIIGFSHDVTRIDNCTNEATATISVNSNTAKWAVAGGIIGDLYWFKTCYKNTNNAAISATNAHSTAPASAGGIIGGDHSNNAGNNDNWGEQNKNYGNITASATVSYAGGVAGYHKRGRLWKNWNYGAITATTAGSHSGYCGYQYAYAYCGGSVNGTALTSGNWQSYKFGAGTPTMVESEGSFVSL